LLLLSVATTVTFPDSPAGTTMYPMNAPPAFAARFAGTATIICPAIWMTIGELAAKPLPMTCTVLPIAAVVGTKLIVGTVKVNVALAALLAASVIVSVLVAVAVIGIVNVAAEIAPAEVVVAALRTTATPLTFAVIALDAANPVPDTAIVVPLLPVVGVRAIVGPTVIADWTLKPVFESVRVIRYVPAKRAVGTMNQVVLLNAFAPEAATVAEPNAGWLLGQYR
jgi:hypothetical protein